MGFKMSISAGEDGTARAVYVQLLDTKITRTEELVQDKVLVDYDRRGRVVGFEIIAPVKKAQITAFVEPPRRAGLRKLIKQMPKELLVA